MHQWQQTLQLAQQHAQRAQFDDFLASCQQIVDGHMDDADALMGVGSLLSAFGFLSAARQCAVRASKLIPQDLRPVIRIADIAREAGDHAESRRLYTALLERLPNHPSVRLNALLSLEYDPYATDAERLEQAVSWGQWATNEAGGVSARPPRQPLTGRPLRVGYVSADFCQHTVGLFVKDVLRSHDPTKVAAHAYSAGSVNDWVTAAIRAACTFRDVSALDDSALADLIRADDIDVLVDLSGHTGGSRLTVFAHRSAPVQISWLGYFATTGLPTIDAVLLDEWHAPPGTEEQFVEPIIRLPGGRFCYTPVSFAPPQVAPSPCLAKGYVTFGCFNNTAKLNDRVYDVWSKVLVAVPDSRLILKWRTFQDAGMCQIVHDAFARRGIAPERIELRGASFHIDLLKEYDDIDIALDPFPFTGGLTSCEALWMGVPVVTWPQGRVVSRQTYAFLSAIGLPELSAADGNAYIRIATELANDPTRLEAMRSTMRARMKGSSLCDVGTFTRTLENTFRLLYERIALEVT